MHHDEVSELIKKVLRLHLLHATQAQQNAYKFHLVH